MVLFFSGGDDSLHVRLRVATVPYPFLLSISPSEAVLQPGKPGDPGPSGVTILDHMLSSNKYLRESCPF